MANRSLDTADVATACGQHIILFLVQLYVPPELMVNKDFIRQILAEEKELMEVDSMR